MQGVGVLYNACILALRVDCRMRGTGMGLRDGAAGSVGIAGTGCLQCSMWVLVRPCSAACVLLVLVTCLILQRIVLVTGLILQRSMRLTTTSYLLDPTASMRLTRTGYLLKQAAASPLHAFYNLSPSTCADAATRLSPALARRTQRASGADPARRP